MAEYNSQRFYWIKLTDRFMTSDTVDFLMEQKDGANYVVLYQMLCLKSINQNGELARRIGEVIIPFDEEKIQRDCKWFSIDTIRVALSLYQRLGLVYMQDNGILKIADFDRLIGSQTISAEKKQTYLANRGGKKVEKIPPDKDIRERDKEKDIKKETDIQTYIKTPRAGAREVSVGQSDSFFAFEDKEDDELKFYHDFLITQLDNGRKKEFNTSDGQRFRAIIDRLKRMKTFSSGNENTPCSTILRALQYFVSGYESESRISDFFAYIDEKIRSGGVKNEFAYMVSAMYNMACNRAGESE